MEGVCRPIFDRCEYFLHPLLLVILVLGIRDSGSTVTLQEGEGGQEVCVSLITGTLQPNRDFTVLLELTSLTTSELTTV